MLLICVSVAFAGNTGDVIQNPKTATQCHDANGKWNPQDKSCDPNSCGCLFHQIEDFIKEFFD